MSRITPFQAQDYLARWQAVATQELAELKSMSVAEKGRQLESLFASRVMFPPDPHALAERVALTDRWNRIRAAYRD